ERIEAVSTDKSSGNFNLKNVERAGTNVLSVEDLCIGYGDNPLAKNINFTLHRGECLGVIGGNGTGKTTFLKTILGKHRELSGKLFWGTKVETGYYSQKLEDLDERNEVLNELRRVASPTATNGELRSFLARFLFIEDDVFKRVSTLSGGEKGRLALAKLIYSQVNVLILDEPTNHLDIPSREALEEALSSYPGTIITVSHDRYFLDQVATQILEIKQDKSVEIETGNYSEYKEWALNRESKVSQESRVESREIEDKPKTEAQNPKSELSKNQRQKIENRIAEIEEEIPANEEKLAALTLKMSEPEIASNHEKLGEVNNEFQIIEQKIQSLYEEWESLLETLNG
nr:ATP-binding cassette domain-containing protein [Pyrinomonadaceae bacterium]